MDTRTVTVDLAKDAFEVLSTNGPTTARHRLSRSQLERFLTSLSSGTEVVMEACGTAHHWGRRCHALGLVPVLLPTPYVRPYVRRNKTDRTDAEALLTHGARSVLFNAHRRARVHADQLSPIQRWVLGVAARRGYNKAVSALANKLARIIWAVWHRDVDFSVTTPAAA